MMINEVKGNYRYRTLTQEYTDSYIKALLKTDLVDAASGEDFIRAVISNAEFILIVMDGEDVVSGATYFYRSPEILLGADFFCLLDDLMEKSRIFRGLLEIMYTIADLKEIYWFCTVGRNQGIIELYRAGGFFNITKEEMVLPLFVLADCIRQIGHAFDLPLNVINRDNEVLYAYTWGEVRFRTSARTIDYRLNENSDGWKFYKKYEYLPQSSLDITEKKGVFGGVLDFVSEVYPSMGLVSFAGINVIMTSPYWTNTEFKQCFLPIHDYDPCEIEEANDILLFHWDSYKKSKSKNHHLQVHCSNRHEAVLLFSCEESVYLRLAFKVHEDPVILEKGFYLENFYFQFSQSVNSSKMIKNGPITELFFFFRESPVELTIKSLDD